ncbi:Caffeine dehydrogenase subunit alpha [archaeon HR01]|nr:Caffeine dehydrogenase subunit alpha [archaeon HR01]
MSLVGKYVKRVEDPRLLRGAGCYVDDLTLPGMLHIGLVRSPHASAEIKSIDKSKALRNGILDVLTGEDLKDIRPLPVESVEAGSKVPDQRVLALGRVRYVGEPVAVVVGWDRYRVRDAVDEVYVEYEPLTPVVDPIKAMAPNSPRVHEGYADNVCFRWRRVYGDVDGAFRESDQVIRLSLRIQRLAPAPMETRGVVASYDGRSDVLTVWSSTQSPHSLREWLAEVLGLSENRLRVIAPDVGGAFGAKYNCYPEDVLASYLSIKYGRPVKWVEDRSENMHTMSHGRDMYADVEAAVRRNGRVEGLRVRIVADLGAYNHSFSQEIPIVTAKMLPGCYDIRNMEVDVVGVFTNKNATHSYRGAGRPEASYIIERTMDRVARRLGLDPAEVRKINFIPRESFPYKSVTGYTYDSGDYVKTLERALQLSDYWNVRKMQPEMRRVGKLVGIGLSSYVEVCNFAYQTAQVRVDRGGKAYVLTGTSPHGQGVATALAQIASDILGIPIEDITVLHGDTALTPRSPGTAGSWSLTSGGNAVFLAASDVREKIIRIAAHLMEANPEDLDVSDGRVYVRGSPEHSLEIKDVAEKAYNPGSLPEGMEPGLVSTRFYKPELTFPFGTHVAIVEVDPETGRVDLRKVVMVNDCGFLVNPVLAEGQIHGGAAQAIGQALYEEHVYDGSGALLTSSFAEYLVPTAPDIPRMETDWTVTPAPNNLGSKGVGEAATIGLTQAIANAIEDAVAHLGVEISETPLTPFRMWRLLSGGR